jgi:acyl-CoA thioester hydrolase
MLSAHPCYLFGVNLLKSEFVFHHRHRVRWAECDPQWVVFNGHYLAYFDVAITEYIRNLGLPGAQAQREQGQEFFARKSTVEYHAPARFDDELDIGVRIAYVGRSSVRFALEVFCGESFLTSGELVYVYVDTNQRASTPLPQAWRDAVKAFEITPLIQA